MSSDSVNMSGAEIFFVLAPEKRNDPACHDDLLMPMIREWGWCWQITVFLLPMHMFGFYLLLEDVQGFLLENLHVGGDSFEDVVRRG